MQIVFNGEFMGHGEAKIGIIEPAVLYGLGCFTTIRLHAGKPRFFDEHWRRFADNMRQLGIELTLTADTALAQIIELGRLNKVAEGAVRISCHPRYEGVDYMIFVTPPRRADPPSAYRVTLSSWPHPGASPLSALKHNNYALFRSAHMEARAAEWDECLLADASQHVIEGAISNFFWVDDEQCLCTPSVASGALPGVIRGKVLELFPAIRERTPHVDQLRRATEIFLTNSSFEIKPVSEIDGEKLAGASGEMTAKVIRGFQEAYPEM